MSNNEEATILKAKIAKMKKEIAEHESKQGEERKRMKELFDKFDTNNDGVLDPKEFALLAYECGIDVSQLKKNKIKQSYDELSGGNKLDFEAFFKWVFKNKTGNDKSASPTLLKLRMKMASKSFVKALKSGGKNLASIKIPEGKIQGGGKERAVAVKLNLGSFDEAKSGVYVSAKNDSKFASEQRNSIDSFPEGVTTFAFVDLPLKANPDIMKVAKTAGAIETALGAIPWQRMGPMSQFFHSISVNMAERKDGRKVIRITMFAKQDPLVFAKNFGVDLTQAPGDLASMDLKFELPFDFDSFQDADLKLNEDLIKFKLDFRVAIKQAFLDSAESMLPDLPFVNDFMWVGLYFFKFFENLGVELAFRTPKEFVEGIPDDLGDNYAVRGLKRMKQNYAKGMGVAGSQGIKNWIAMGANMAVAMVPPFAKIYYKNTRELTTGLDGARVHVQTNNTTFTVDLKGLNFAQFMAPLPAN